MANGIQMIVGEDASETVKFVRMMDRFFDCFNVNNFCTGIQKRKVFQVPYHEAEDFHLKVHVNIEGVMLYNMLYNKCVYIMYLSTHAFLVYIVVARRVSTLSSCMGD